jgi:hypothetical protein
MLESFYTVCARRRIVVVLKQINHGLRGLVNVFRLAEKHLEEGRVARQKLAQQSGHAGKSSVKLLGKARLYRNDPADASRRNWKGRLGRNG